MLFDLLTKVFRSLELQRRILFTLALLAIYRLGDHIPLPGTDLQHWLPQGRDMTIFALGIAPYISAWIVWQFLAAVVPRIDKNKIASRTRYLTLFLAFGQSYGVARSLEVTRGFVALTVLSMTAGSIFVMWLAEQITERGIGNGIALIIFADIVAHVGPVKGIDVAAGISLTAMMIVVAALVVFVGRGQRYLPIQYVKRGPTTYIPLKVNMAGVMPLIFAASLLGLHTVRPLPLTGFVALNIFFCFSYTAIIFNAAEAAKNLRRLGGFVPGIRPGWGTADYIHFIVRKTSAIAALYLSALCLLADILASGTVWGKRLAFGGVSVLIVAGAATDFIAQIESHQVARYVGYSPPHRPVTPKAA
jgi:preprotein translocase subunit SecY